MPGILELMGHIDQQGERGRQQGKQSRLAQLASQAYAAPESERRGFVQQAIATDPTSGFGLGAELTGDRNASMKQLAERAGMFVSVAKSGDPQQAAGMYGPLAQEANRLGFQVPTEYDPAFLPGLERLAAAAGGSGTNVQSTYIDAQGNRVAILRDGSTQVLGQNAPNNQIIDTGNGFFGVNKGNLQAAPVMTGPQQQPQQPQQQSANGLQPSSVDSIISGIERDLGRPLSAGERALLQTQNAQSGGSFNIGAGQPSRIAQPPISAIGGGQLRSAPNQQEQTRLAMDAERLRLEQDRAGVPAGFRRSAAGGLEPIPGGPADPSTIKPMSAAQQAQVQQKMRKEKQLLSANDAGIDQTVKLIDSILSRRGDLAGVTGIGRVGSMVPGTDWADVAAKIDTLKGRSAFGALQQMRANSPTGGALGQVSERELYLLQNAETQLQQSQSPESLAQALRDYRAALLESKQRMRQGVDEFYSEQGAAQSAPASQGGGVLTYNPATGDFE